jgi:triacylglycerol lipase
VPAGRVSTASTDYPVLLVHGILANHTVFDVQDDPSGPPSTPPKVSMVKALTQAGYTVGWVDLPGNYGVENAYVIQDRVNHLLADTHAKKVYVVAHSLGGFSSRFYAKYLDNDKVAGYVSFGTSHHGYAGACGLPAILGGEICPTSPFLRYLNAGDDTPGSFLYTSIRSITPGPNGPGDVADADWRLDGGACLADVDGGEHGNEPSNPTIIATVLQALSGTCPGVYQNLTID